MHRRQLLRAITVTATASLAGCADASIGGGTPTRTASPTATASPTPSPTPTDSPTPTPVPAPEILAANLVSEMTEFGDVEDNRIEEAEAGEFILVGMRYSTTVRDGSVDTTEQVEIYDAEDTRVGFKQDTGELLSEETGTTIIEHALEFDTMDWGTGEYDADVIVRDNHTGTVSPTYSFSFDLV